MAKEAIDSLRKHLGNLLSMQGAHITLDAAVEDFPVAARAANARRPNTHGPNTHGPNTQTTAHRDTPPSKSWKHRPPSAILSWFYSRSRFAWCPHFSLCD